MRRNAIRYTVAALLVGLLAACGQKPDEGKPAPESKPDSSGFTVPDKELGLDYYRANFDQVQPTYDWCRRTSPDKRTAAQDRNCKAAAHAKMAPKKPGSEAKQYEGFKGGTLK